MKKIFVVIGLHLRYFKSKVETSAVDSKLRTIKLTFQYEIIMYCSCIVVLLWAWILCASIVLWHL